MAVYLQGKPIHQGRLGLLPSAFNPPTLAHLGLAQAAQREQGLDQVAFVLPKTFPHKQFEFVTFEQRLSLLKTAIAGHPAWAAATAGGGLVYEIAREFQPLCGESVEVFLLCGRDAAARFIGWDYGDGPSIGDQLEEFQLLVASRLGDYHPPPELSKRIHAVNLSERLQAISSSSVRDALGSGRPWKHLVPAAVAAAIEDQQLYR